jgi:hypothetical protein
MTNDEKAEQAIRVRLGMRSSPELTAFAATTLRNIRRGDSEASLMQRLGAFQVDNGQAIDNRASAQLFTVLSRVAFGDL